MAKTALFSANDAGSRHTLFHEEDGKTYFQTFQNVDPVISAVQILREKTPDKDLRHVAEIPMAVWAQSIQEGWENDPVAWKRWANDPANECFRVWPGKI